MSILSSSNSPILKAHYWAPDFLMAYWSWVIKQNWYKDGEKPMIDLVVWARNTKRWHKENIDKNSWDYSWIVRKIWVDFAEFLQRRWAKIFYNPFIGFKWEELKYWVIQIDDLVSDLQNWDSLYVAWRLQKPVQILSCSEDVKRAMDKNFENAVNVAILLLWENFTEEELYMMIAWISYRWDSRMWIAENPDKISNIVSRNLEWFRKIYLWMIESKNWITRNEDGSFTQEITWERQLEIIKLLPKNLQKWLDKRNFEDTDYREYLQEDIKWRISQIVNWPSITQTIKWLLTAWVKKSARYSWEKLKKWKIWKVLVKSGIPKVTSVIWSKVFNSGKLKIKSSKTNP